MDADPGGGGRYVVNPRSDRLQVSSHDEYMAVHKTLLADAEANGPDRRYDVVIWDPGGGFLGFANEYTRKQLGVEEITGFDHNKVAANMRNMWLELLRAGYWLLMTDHLRKKLISKTGEKEEIVTEALLPASVLKYLEQDCHHIFTLGLEWIPVTVVDPKSGKEKMDKKLLYHVSTRPGRRTSLANPKTRVWLPEEFPEWPQSGDSSELWDAYDAIFQKSITAMATHNDKKKG